jgi:hypothetical protein
MLRLDTPTGSLELSADQERALRAMSDADVCRELNCGHDLYVFAVLKERPQIQLHPAAGWVYYPAEHVTELKACGDLAH